MYFFCKVVHELGMFELFLTIYKYITKPFYNITLYYIILLPCIVKKNSGFNLYIIVHSTPASGGGGAVLLLRRSFLICSHIQKPMQRTFLYYNLRCKRERAYVSIISILQRKRLLRMCILHAPPRRE